MKSPLFGETRGSGWTLASPFLLPFSEQSDEEDEKKKTKKKKVPEGHREGSSSEEGSESSSSSSESEATSESEEEQAEPASWRKKTVRACFLPPRPDVFPPFRTDCDVSHHAREG